MQVDIIGAGISGLSAAISLKEQDSTINVTIHEKNKQVGYNPEGRRCGEGISLAREWVKWKPKKESFYNEIRNLELIIGKKIYNYVKEPGNLYVLNKQEYICQLEKKAKNQGVEIITNDKIKTANGLDGDFIVDGSGPSSVIKKELGLKMKLMGIGYQQTIENSNLFIKDKLKLFFTGTTGYIWIFPRNPSKKEINIGVGALIGQKLNLKEILEEFKNQNNITGKINYTLGGLIPMGMQKPLIYNNILFVGDAGVGTLPFFAEGNYRALMSGEAAGICIAQNKIKQYPQLMNNYFLKWDISGCMFLKIHNIFEKIGPKAAINLLNLSTKINDRTGFLKLGE